MVRMIIFHIYFQIELKDVTRFPVTFWLIAVICVAFYVTIFPFISVAAVFFHTKFGFSTKEASALQGNGLLSQYPQTNVSAIILYMCVYYINIYHTYSRHSVRILCRSIAITRNHD